MNEAVEKRPKVSVCIPVYNRPEYVKETIESVLAQTFKDFEIIVSDNCSTDNTFDVVKSYAAKDSRIKLYRNQSTLVACSNINLSILPARGEYIKPLFSDDKLAPTCLERFINIFDNYPKVSLVTSYTKAFGGNDSVRDGAYFPATGEIDGKFAQKDLLINGNWVGSPSSIMFRRQDLHIGLFDHLWIYWLGDLDLSMRLLGLGNAYVIPEILSSLRIHKQQISSIYATDFKLMKERLQLANVAFWFPHLYGEYSKSEQKKIYRHLLKRLVREGLGQKGLKPKMDMLKMGFSRLCYNRAVFCWILLKNLNRLFKKRKDNTEE